MTSEAVTETDTTADPVMLGHYLAAIEEIFELRAVLAHEADTIESHLQLRTFPPSRRAIAEIQVQRMRAAIRRPAKLVYGDRPFRYGALRRLGAAILTRGMWEEREQPLPPPPVAPLISARRPRSGRRWIAKQ